MSYCLERRTRQGAGRSRRTVWVRYAVCGSRSLLERVRMGQEHPGCWRVRPTVCGKSYEGHQLAG